MTSRRAPMRERDHGLRDRGGRAAESRAVRGKGAGGEGRRQRDIPRPNELQPTSGILLKMRGRGLPEGWPRAVEGRTLFRAARAPGPFRPACRPDRRLAVRTSAPPPIVPLLLSRAFEAARGWSSQPPFALSYPRRRSPIGIGTRCSDAGTNTHVRSGGLPYRRTFGGLETDAKT